MNCANYHWLDWLVSNTSLNKKVLLRECKRHTARLVATTPSVVFTVGWGGGTPIPGPDPDSGVPHPRSRWGYPIPDWGVPHPRSRCRWVVPHPRSRWRYPIPGRGKPSLVGYPPHLDLAGVPHPIWTWPGYPHLDLARVPPSGPGQGTTHLDLARVPPIGTWLGYPPSGPGWGTPLWTDRQTRVKTLPFRRTTYAGGNKVTQMHRSKIFTLSVGIQSRTSWVCFLDF